MNRTAGSAIRCVRLEAGSLHDLGVDDAVQQIRGAIAAPRNVPDGDFIWMDITNPGESDAELLRDDVGIHPLAVEDCLRGRQRPKLDSYPSYSFIVFYAARINQDRARMALNEIQIFIGEGFLITVHDLEIRETDVVMEFWRASPGRWPTSLALSHAVIDRIVDNYFPLVEHFSSRIEDFEEQVFSDAPTLPMKRVAQFRRELIHFRRILGPERDVLSILLRREMPTLNREILHYFQDVHDHILRVTEEMDTLRDLLAGLMEIQTSNNGRQLNQTMQALTAWSIILMTMALIAGIYGMNFDFMPELDFQWGYFGSLLLMAGLGVALLGYFRRKNWL